MRNTPLTSGKHESQWARPMSRRETGCVSAEVEVETCHHAARGDEDEKRLPWGPSFETNEGLDRIVVHCPAEPIDGFRGIGEHAITLDMNDRIGDSRFNLRRGPERNRTRSRHLAA